jgi:hypothetical protein
MNSKISIVLLVLMSASINHLAAQETSQPASDVLLQFDPWGNPTPRGGVTNNGPNSHSVW